MDETAYDPTNEDLMEMHQDMAAKAAQLQALVWSLGVKSNEKIKDQIEETIHLLTHQVMDDANL